MEVRERGVTPWRSFLTEWEVWSHLFVHLRFWDSEKETFSFRATISLPAAGRSTRGCHPSWK